MLLVFLAEAGKKKPCCTLSFCRRTRGNRRERLSDTRHFSKLNSCRNVKPSEMGDKRELISSILQGEIVDTISLSCSSVRILRFNFRVCTLSVPLDEFCLLEKKRGKDPSHFWNWLLRGSWSPSIFFFPLFFQFRNGSNAFKSVTLSVQDKAMKSIRVFTNSGFFSPFLCSTISHATFETQI